ncbi:hypothetical protein BC829DRAFT_63720 [Chytridium lagenaria]|nr:hypothetical protein BC829DRAFT_63720 [Chytridium lagenaria]
MFTSRLPKTLITITGIGITTSLLVTAQTPQIPIPNPSLLSSSPTSKIYADAFKLSTPPPHHHQSTLTPQLLSDAIYSAWNGIYCPSSTWVDRRHPSLNLVLSLNWANLSALYGR